MEGKRRKQKEVGGMKAEKLAAILATHVRWLRNSTEGARANFRGADLRDADLPDADLPVAN